MDRSKLCSVFSGLILCIFVSWTSQQACNHTLFGLEDTLYTLSDELVDADSAVSKCSTLGGYLTMITDETIKSSFVKAATEKYTKDLVRMWIFYNYQEKQYTGYFNSPEELGNWRSAKRLGHLDYIDLFSSQREAKRAEIWFCYGGNGNNEFWKVLPVERCGGNYWSQGFKLYGLKSKTPGYKEVFVYQNRKSYASAAISYSFRIFSKNESNDVYESYRDSFFGPDINIFTGVRFNVSTSNWQWSNGSHARLDSTGINTCQQQTMHYGEGWEVTNKSCKNQPAYYSCQSKFTISAHSLPCQSSRIVVTWRDSLLKFGSENMKVKITLSGNGADLETSIPYSKRNFTFVNLLPRVTYIVKALLYTTCNNVSVQATSLVKTSFGVPDDFNFARVSSIDNCDVEVSPLMGPISTILIYSKIFAQRETNPTVHTFSVNKTHFTIPLSQHGSHIVTLEVQAATCEGYNARMPVLGYCQVKKNSAGTAQAPVNAKSPITAIAGASGGLLVLVLLLAVFVSFRRFQHRTKNEESQVQVKATQDVNHIEMAVHEERFFMTPIDHQPYEEIKHGSTIYENVCSV